MFSTCIFVIVIFSLRFRWFGYPEIFTHPTTSYYVDDIIITVYIIWNDCQAHNVPLPIPQFFIFHFSFFMCLFKLS